MLLTKPKVVATAVQQHTGVLAVPRLAAGSRSVAADVRARAQATEKPKAPGASTVLENANTDYCNDFECTSSPAVEQTVKSLSLDLQRHCGSRYTASLFVKDVKFTVGAATESCRDHGL